MEWFAILLPFAQSIFSKVFQGCATPASGQTRDPQVELDCHMLPDGTFSPAFLRQNRPNMRRAIRAANKGKSRRDPKFVPIGSVDLDAESEKFFQHVVHAPRAYVMTGYRAGVSSKLDE